MNLFNSALKISESFTYVYNDNSENKEKHPENLRISLSYKQLSVSYSSSYTYKYDLYTDKIPEGKKAGYNQRTEKEFVPYSVSLSYSLPSKTYTVFAFHVNPACVNIPSKLSLPKVYVAIKVFKYACSL